MLPTAQKYPDISFLHSQVPEEQRNFLISEHGADLFSLDPHLPRSRTIRSSALENNTSQHALHNELYNQNHSSDNPIRSKDAKSDLFRDITGINGNIPRQMLVNISSNRIPLYLETEQNSIEEVRNNVYLSDEQGIMYKKRGATKRSITSNSMYNNERIFQTLDSKNLLMNCTYILRRRFKNNYLTLTDPYNNSLGLCPLHKVSYHDLADNNHDRNFSNFLTNVMKSFVRNRRPSSDVHIISYLINQKRKKRRRNFSSKLVYSPYYASDQDLKPTRQQNPKKRRHVTRPQVVRSAGETVQTFDKHQDTNQVRILMDSTAISKLLSPLFDEMRLPLGLLNPPVNVAGFPGTVREGQKNLSSSSPRSSARRKRSGMHVVAVTPVAVQVARAVRAVMQHFKWKNVKIVTGKL